MEEKQTKKEVETEYEERNRKIVYVNLVTETMLITAEIAKNILSYETEPEFQIRSMKDNPGTRREHWTFCASYHTTDERDNKVRCWNVPNECEFDDTVTSATSVDVVISKTGIVQSGAALLLSIAMERVTSKTLTVTTGTEELQYVYETSGTTYSVVDKDDWDDLLMICKYTEKDKKRGDCKTFVRAKVEALSHLRNMIDKCQRLFNRINNSKTYEEYIG